MIFLTNAFVALSGFKFRQTPIRQLKRAQKVERQIRELNVGMLQMDAHN